MKAMTVSDWGGIENLKAADIPMPEMSSSDVLIKVIATSVNPVDTKIRQGMLTDLPLPHVLGYDVSGIIEDKGNQVNGFDIGDEVYASPSLARPGANAEYVSVDYRLVSPKPESLGHIESAALPLVGLTAYESLIQRANIQPNEKILIHAGAGGVGHIAVQIAIMHGLTVYATASRPESISYLQSLDVNHVINYKLENVSQRVLELTDGQGVPVIMDCVGGKTINDSLEAASPNGRLVSILPGEDVSVQRAFFMKNLTLHYEFMGAAAVYGVGMEKQGAILRHLSKWIDQVKLKPHVYKTWSFDDIPQAHLQQQSATTIGKQVIQISA